MKRLSGLVHILCVLCFLLPFVQVSCNNQKLATLTGVELASGRYNIQGSTDLNFGQSTSAPQTQSGSIEWTVLIALVCALAAGVFAFLGNRGASLISILLGAVGTVSLLYFRSKSPDTSQSMGLITVSYEFGYYLALLLLIAGTAAVFFFEFIAGKKQPAMAGAPGSPPMYAAPPVAPRPGGAAAFCPNCGKPSAGGAAFCDGCGKPLPR